MSEVSRVGVESGSGMAAEGRYEGRLTTDGRDMYRCSVAVQSPRLVQSFQTFPGRKLTIALCCQRRDDHQFVDASKTADAKD